jgi:2-oxo-4-hydroxy-4-carboxy-5-ureidoimidazoline decarboxylase
VNETLAAWNASGDTEARNAMLACCGAKRWADAMAALRPIASVFELSEAADRVWATMQEADWLEAFACHPRIGQRKVSMHAGEQSAAWSRAEQAQTNSASDQVMTEIADGNQRYEELFGFTYIVCATGKSAEEMLAILKRRLESTREIELREAAEQQRQILQIRLGKWLIE